MMDTGQRVVLAKGRARQMRRRREKRLTGRLSLVSAALCCCLIYGLGYFSGKSPGAVQDMNGATMLLENAGGYVLVGVLCFIAAVVITVLCIRSREKAKKENDKSEEDEEI